MNDVLTGYSSLFLLDRFCVFDASLVALVTSLRNASYQMLSKSQIPSHCMVTFDSDWDKGVKMKRDDPPLESRR